MLLPAAAFLIERCPGQPQLIQHRDAFICRIKREPGGGTKSETDIGISSFLRKGCAVFYAFFKPGYVGNFPPCFEVLLRRHD